MYSTKCILPVYKYSKHIQVMHTEVKIKIIDSIPIQHFWQKINVRWI